MGPNNVWDLKTNSRGTQTDLVAERTISECLTELKSSAEFQDLTYRLSRSHQDELCLLITREKMLGLLGMPVDPVTVCITASGVCSLNVIFLPIDTHNIMHNGQISLKLFRNILRKLNGRAGYGFCPGFKVEDFPKDFPFSKYGLKVLQQPFMRVQAKGCPVFYQCQKLRATVQPLALELCPICWKAAAGYKSSLESPDAEMKVPATHKGSQHCAVTSFANSPSMSELMAGLHNGTASVIKSEIGGSVKEERKQNCLQLNENVKPSSSVSHCKTSRKHSQSLRKESVTSVLDCQSYEKNPASNPLSVGDTSVPSAATSLDVESEQSSSMSLTAARDKSKKDFQQASEATGSHRLVLSARIKPFQTSQNLPSDVDRDIHEIVLADTNAKLSLCQKQAQINSSASSGDVEMIAHRESEASGEIVLSPYSSPRPLCIDEDADDNEEPDLKRSCLRCSACQEVFTSSAELSDHCVNCSQHTKTEHLESAVTITATADTKSEDAPPTVTIVKTADLALAPQSQSKICPICQQGFLYKHDLENHLVQKHRAKLHPCRYCGQKFALRSNLSAHLQHHRGSADLKCKECGAKFVGKKAFAAHVKTHMGSYPYFCTLCSRFFGNVSSYEKHMDRHKMRRPVNMLAGSVRMVHGILGKAKRCLEEKVQMSLSSSLTASSESSLPTLANLGENEQGVVNSAEDKVESGERKDCNQVDIIRSMNHTVSSPAEGLSGSSLPQPNTGICASSQDCLSGMFTASQSPVEQGIAASANLQLLSAVSLAQAELDGHIPLSGSQKEARLQPDLTEISIIDNSAEKSVVPKTNSTSSSTSSLSPTTFTNPRSQQRVIMSLSKQETEQMMQLGALDPLESGGRVTIENLPSTLRERIKQAIATGESSGISSRQEEPAAAPASGIRALAASPQSSSSTPVFELNFSSCSENRDVAHRGRQEWQGWALDGDLLKGKTSSGEQGPIIHKQGSELLQRLVAPPLLPMEIQEGRQPAQAALRAPESLTAHTLAGQNLQDEQSKTIKMRTAADLSQPAQGGEQERDAQGNTTNKAELSRREQYEKQSKDHTAAKDRAILNKLLIAQLLQRKQRLGNEGEANLPGEITVSRHLVRDMLAALNTAGGSAAAELPPVFRQPLPGSAFGGHKLRSPFPSSASGIRMSCPPVGMRPSGQSASQTVGSEACHTRKPGADDITKLPSPQLIHGSATKVNGPNNKEPPQPSFSNITSNLSKPTDVSLVPAGGRSVNSQTGLQSSRDSLPQVSVFSDGSMLEQMMKLESIMPSSAKEFLPSASPHKKTPSQALRSLCSPPMGLESPMSNALNATVESDMSASKNGKKIDKNQGLRARSGAREKTGVRGGGSRSLEGDPKHSQWSGGLVKEKPNRVVTVVPPGEIERLLNLAKNVVSPISLDISTGSQPSPQSPVSQPSPRLSSVGVSSSASSTSASSPATLMAGLSPVSASPSSPSNSVSSRQATAINRPSSSLPGSPRPFTIPMPPLIPAAEAFAPSHMPAWQISSSSSSSSSLDDGDMAPIDLTKPDKRVPLQEPSPLAVHGAQVTGDRLCSPKRSDATMAGSGIQTQVPRRLASNEQIEKERGNGASKNYIEVLDHANRSTASASIQGAPQSLSFPHHPHTVTMAQDSLTPHATAKASMCSLPLSAVQTPVSHEEAPLQGPLSIRAVTSQQRPLLHASLTSPSIMSQNVVRLPQNVITPTLLESLQPGVNPHVIAAPQNIRSPLAAQHQNPPPFMPNAPSLNSVALYSRAPSASHTTLPNFLIDPKTGPDVSSLGSTQSLAKSDPIRASPLGGFLWHRPQVSEGLTGKGTDVHDNTRGLCKTLERESLVQHADVSHRHANKDHESNVRSIAGTHHPASTSYGNRIIDAGACSSEEFDRTNEWRQNFISVLHQTRRQRPHQQPLEFEPMEAQPLTLDVQPAQQQEGHFRRTVTKQPRGRRRTEPKRSRAMSKETLLTAPAQTVPGNSVSPTFPQEDCWTAGGEENASERRYVLSHLPADACMSTPVMVPRESRSKRRSVGAVKNTGHLTNQASPANMAENVDANRSAQMRSQDLQQRREECFDGARNERVAVDTDADLKADSGEDFVQCDGCSKCFYNEEEILKHECESS